MDVVANVHPDDVEARKRQDPTFVVVPLSEPQTRCGSLSYFFAGVWRDSDGNIRGFSYRAENEVADRYTVGAPVTLWFSGDEPDEHNIRGVAIGRELCHYATEGEWTARHRVQLARREPGTDRVTQEAVKRFLNDEDQVASRAWSLGGKVHPHLGAALNQRIKVHGVPYLATDYLAHVRLCYRATLLMNFVTRNYPDANRKTIDRVLLRIRKTDNEKVSQMVGESFGDEPEDRIYAARLARTALVEPHKLAESFGHVDSPDNQIDRLNPSVSRLRQLALGLDETGPPILTPPGGSQGWTIAPGVQGPPGLGADPPALA